MSTEKIMEQPVNVRLLEALKRLSFCAQTTGGVAGRDDELCSAIEASAKAIAAAQAREMRDEWAAGTVACANAIRARGQK